MWIANLPQEVLCEMIRWHPCAGFLLDNEGRVVGANKAFQNWSGYSLVQLQHLDIQRIHNVTDMSQDDLLTQCRRLTPQDPNSMIRTQFRANGEAPEWGKLRILRTTTADNSVVYYWCVWEPFCDESREAFAAAMKLIGESSTAMIELQKEVRSYSARDQDEDLVIATLRFARRYPKITMGFAMLIASVFGLSNIVQVAKQLGFLPADPIVIEPKQVWQQPEELPKATGIASTAGVQSDLMLQQSPITVHYNRPKVEGIKWQAPTRVLNSETQ